MFLIGFLNQNVVFAQEHNRCAFVVGLSDYNTAETGWNPIHGDNDLRLMHQILQRQHFPEGRIFLVGNEQGTKAAILHEMQRFLEQVGVGDEVYIHFSAHGQQIRDDNFDEIDGLDEAIVPLDAPRSAAACMGYSGENHIRDDELEIWLLAIRVKAGLEGRVLYVGDYCHSGSSTRGVQHVRGAALTFEGEESPELSSSESYMELSSLLTGASNLLCIFATSPNEINSEVKISEEYFGSLSYAVGRSLLKEGPQTGTELLKEIRQWMATSVPNQSPQYEGDPNDFVWSGGCLPRGSFPITKVSTDKRRVSIACGILQGGGVGAKVRFIDRSGKSWHFEGTVVASDVLSSQVVVDHPVPAGFARSYNAIITSRINVGVGLRMAVDPSTDTAQNQLLEIIRSLSDLIWLQMVSTEQAPDIIVTMRYISDGRSELVLTNSFDELINRFSSDKLSASSLLDFLRKYAVSRYLSCWEERQTAQDLGFWMYDFSNESILVSNSGRYLMKEKALKVGSQFRIRIENTNSKGLYFSMIDISPDGTFRCINPISEDGKGIEVLMHNYIEPGQTLDLPANPDEFWTIGSPAGREILKLVSSTEPIRICPALEALNSNGNVRSIFRRFDVIDDCMKYFYNSENEGVRGGVQLSNTNLVNVETLVFSIVD